MITYASRLLSLLFLLTLGSITLQAQETSTNETKAQTETTPTQTGEKQAEATQSAASSKNSEAKTTTEPEAQPSTQAEPTVKAPSKEETEAQQQNFETVMVKPEHITALNDDVIGRLEAGNLTDSEREVINRLKAFSAKQATFMKTIHYHFARLDEEVSAMHGNPSVDPNVIVIGSLYQIVSALKARKITLQNDEEILFLDRVEALVNNREILTTAQRNEVKGLLYQAEQVRALRSIETTIKRLVGEVGVPLTFNARLTKYTREVGRVSYLPERSVEKTTFIASVASILDAPGQRTLSELKALEESVLGPIKFGKFTDKQRDMLAPLKQKLAPLKAELEKKLAADQAARAALLKSATYHIDQADTVTTPDEYHTKLKAIFDGLNNNSITVTPQDRGALISVLKEEVDLRPLEGGKGSALDGIITQAQTTTGFKEDSALSDRLKNMREELERPVATLERAKYFANNVMSSLALPAQDGDRARFFARMQGFIPLLAMTKDKRVTTEEGVETLQDTQKSIDQYKGAKQASTSEKSTMDFFSKQLKMSSEKAKKKIEAAKEKAAKEAERRALLSSRVSAARIGTGAAAGARVKSKSISGNRFRSNRRGSGMIYVPS